MKAAFTVAAEWQKKKKKGFVFMGGNKRFQEESLGVLHPVWGKVGLRQFHAHSQWSHT